MKRAFAKEKGKKRKETKINRRNNKQQKQRELRPECESMEAWKVT
jgi:hypothetical protein